MPSVLIVDDEPNIRRMVGALLGAEGYDVRDAADGVTGLALADANEPDVALVDLMMPGDLDGLALLQKLRERRPDMPVVMMSGRAALADAVLQPVPADVADRRERFAGGWLARQGVGRCRRQADVGVGPHR